MNEIALQNQLQELFKNRNQSCEITYLSNSKQDTIELGMQIAKFLTVGDILVLNGELGSGKTVFVMGVAKYFDIEEQVSSPTFTIVNEYNLNNEKNMYHFDVYRLEDADEFEQAIGTDYFVNGISIIEWGNIIADILPKTTIYIDIFKDEWDENKRKIKIWRK